MINVERNSVQVLPDADGNGASGDFWWYYQSQRSDPLPAWGTQARERALMEAFYHPYSWLFQSAVAGLIKKVVGTSWTITGTRNVDYFQNLLLDAEFGAGWDVFVARLLLSYFRHDRGGFFEVIAPGNPRYDPTGRVAGIATLETLQVLPTGNPEFPAIYTDVDGKQHMMQRRRIVQMTDTPDVVRGRRGYGLSALSRAISIVRRNVEATKYVESKLDDQPVPGFVTASNLNKQQLEAARQQYVAEQSMDARPIWSKTFWLFGIDPEHTAELKFLSFQQAPENWSFKEYTELDVNCTALALGIDVQELWQLTGGNIGSAGQSAVLHAKSQGKTFGVILTTLERIINTYVLPPSLKFAFKYRDPYDADERATTAAKWAGVNLSVASTLSPDEQRRFLAATIEEYATVVRDPDGTIRSLTDADPEDATQTQDDLGGVPGQVDTATQDDAAPAEKEYPTLQALIAPVPSPLPGWRKALNGVETSGTDTSGTGISGTGISGTGISDAGWKKALNGVKTALRATLHRNSDKAVNGVTHADIEHLRGLMARNKALIAEYHKETSR